MRHGSSGGLSVGARSRGACLLLAGCDDAEDGGAKAKRDAPPPPEVTVAKPLVRG